MKLQKLLVIALVSMFLLSIGAAIPARAYPDTNVYIDPAAVDKYTDTTPINAEFDIYIKFGNFSDLAGIEFKMSWNATILQCVKIVDTPPWPSVYVGKNQTTQGAWWLSILDVTDPKQPFTGSATLRKATMKILIAPPEGIGNYLTTAFHLYNSVWGNSAADPITHDLHDGVFNYYYVAPPEPNLVSDSKDMTALGTFYLPVRVTNYAFVWDLVSVHFEMHYDTTLLNALNVIDGGFIGGASVIFDISTPGIVIVDVSGTEPTTTSGKVVEILFDAIYGEEGNILSCPLDLQNANFDTPAIEYFTVVTDGLYRMMIPSPALKAMGVEPPVTTVIDEGVVFTVDIYVYNITSVDKLFGAQFSLAYDPTMLELISVAPGPYFYAFNWTTPREYSVYMFFYPHAGWFTVATGLVGGGPEPPGYVYPNGAGSIATITFKATYGVPGSTIGCALDLYGVILGNIFGEEIPCPIVHDGQYFIVLDKRYIDIFTQYPYPYGGQLRYHDSDAFAPQQEVCITAYLEYNGWPIQNKPVNFEIHGPANPIYNITLYRVAFTNSSGYATICFRIDWPCEFPEDIVFGTWTVLGSADVDEITVTDILHFEVGWLVTITKITLNEDAYAHLWHMTITLDYTSISHQLRPVFFTVTMYDDAGYGLGSMTFSKTVGYGDGTVTMTCFSIPKWARAGIGTVYADAYTAQPWLGGVAYCPEVSKTFTILAA